MLRIKRVGNPGMERAALLDWYRKPAGSDARSVSIAEQEFDGDGISGGISRCELGTSGTVRRCPIWLRGRMLTTISIHWISVESPVPAASTAAPRNEETGADAGR